MEVTTVTPSPTSPTEGDDLCEVDVTSVAIHSVSLLICLCGLAGNGALLCLLKLKAFVYNIFRLAVTDFFCLLFTVPSVLLFLVEDMTCSTIMPLLYLSFLFQLSFISYSWVVYWLPPSHTVLDMLEICCDCYFPARLHCIMDHVQYRACFAFFTVIPSVTSLCLSHEQEHCRAALISSYAIILLLFVAPMFISSTMKIIRAKRGSQQQQQRKWHDISFFFTVLFIVLLSLWNFLQQLGYTTVPSQVVFLLTCIHSSIKPFIYFLAGRCWWPSSVESLRNSLQRVFEEQEENPAHSDDSSVDTED